MKHLHITFLLAMLMSMMGYKASAYSFAVENADGKTIYYNSLGGNTVAVTCKDYNYNSYSGEINIPESVTYNEVTYAVTVIGNHVFQNCSRLTSVTIPNSVTSINNYTFHNCI